MSGLFPLAFASDEVRLLTGLVLGFLFGVTLERAGFGNARKLAAQFYGHDLTVFKVMFTAILVAMVGLYALVGLGWVDLAMLWINPTFLWAQLVGGFLLGAGFIMSGLCPGTSVVSAASGRWDALVTLVGIFLGTGVFVVAVDVVPALETLYHAGSFGVALLPELLGAPPLVFALAVVAVAGAAFVLAERVEEHFAARYGRIELSPRPRPRLALATAGTLALLGFLGLGAARAPAAEAEPAPLTSLAPLDLAERIIARDPTLFLVDLRAGEPEGRIPGAYPGPTDEAVLGLLATVPAGMDVIVYDDRGTLTEAPPAWPRHLTYHAVWGGWMGWELQVLTPSLEGSGSVAERAWAARQNQISAFFTGVAVEGGSGAPPPPPMPAGGGLQPKKKGGGC
jgi:hypothetical protein